ncbi:MAG: hypothetical protein U0Z26_18425 [Anaerolineales bacterium]
MKFTKWVKMSIQKEGLNLFADFGMDVSFVPHWNNAEGGIDLDTSRCFMGMERFDQWRKMIPENNVVVGLDEHSGVIVDFEKGICDVHGVSSVSVLKGASSQIHSSGASFSLSELGALQLPEPLESGIRPEIWEMTLSASKPQEEKPSDEVLAWLDLRQSAREQKNFAESDRLRDLIASQGWQVKDSKEGQKLTKS